MRSRLALAAAALAVCFSPAAARALTITLETELDEGLVGPHATLKISERGGALDFVLRLSGTDLGPGSDLHLFYFNLAGSPANVSLTSTQYVHTPFQLLVDPPVAGGAGASFEYGVNFGDGKGIPGNGELKTARFTISASAPLTIASLSPLSHTAQGIALNFALHVQGTSYVFCIESETVGGALPIPEPATALLLAAGLAGFAAARRRS